MNGPGGCQLAVGNAGVMGVGVRCDDGGESGELVRGDVRGMEITAISCQILTFRGFAAI